MAKMSESERAERQVDWETKQRHLREAADHEEFAAAEKYIAEQRAKRAQAGKR